MRLIFRCNFFGCFAIVHALQRDLWRQSSLAPKPLRSCCTGFEASRWRIDITLEHLGSTGYDEGDGLNIAIIDRLEAAQHFIFVQVNATLGKEGNASLWVGRLVFGEVFEFVVFVFVVSDVSVTALVSISKAKYGRVDPPFTSEVQALRAIVPERHADTRNGVEDLKATNRLRRIAWVPKAQLTVAHARESSRGNAVGLSHPNGTAVLGAWVAGNFLRGLLLPHIPHSQLLVPAGGDEQRSVSAPRQ